MAQTKCHPQHQFCCSHPKLFLTTCHHSFVTLHQLQPALSLYSFSFSSSILVSLGFPQSWHLKSPSSPSSLSWDLLPSVTRPRMYLVLPLIPFWSWSLNPTWEISRVSQLPPHASLSPSHPLHPSGTTWNLSWNKNVRCGTSESMNPKTEKLSITLLIHNLPTVIKDPKIHPTKGRPDKEEIPQIW